MLMFTRLVRISSVTSQKGAHAEDTRFKQGKETPSLRRMEGPNRERGIRLRYRNRRKSVAISKCDPRMVFWTDESYLGNGDSYLNQSAGGQFGVGEWVGLMTHLR